MDRIKVAALLVSVPTIGAMYVAYVLVTHADGIVLGSTIGAIGFIIGRVLFGKT